MYSTIYKFKKFIILSLRRYYIFTFQLSIIPLVYSTKLPYSIIKRIKLYLIYITKKIER